MVSFSCDNCMDVFTKKKIDNHIGNCQPKFITCIDCHVRFYDNSYTSHTSCISEAEKVEGSLYKGKKTTPQSNGKSNGSDAKQTPSNLPTKQSSQVTKKESDNNNKTTTSEAVNPKSNPKGDDKKKHNAPEKKTEAKKSTKTKKEEEKEKEKEEEEEEEVVVEDKEEEKGDNEANGGDEVDTTHKKEKTNGKKGKEKKDTKRKRESEDEEKPKKNKEAKNHPEDQRDIFESVELEKVVIEILKQEDGLSVEILREKISKRFEVYLENSLHKTLNEGHGGRYLYLKKRNQVKINPKYDEE